MSAATITLLFLLFAVVMFVFEKIPLGVTSMIVCIGLVVTGVLDVKTAFAGFIDSNVILFVAMFIVGGALFETGMANKIGGIVTHFAKSERSLIVAIMVIVGLMSGVLSNTGTAAVLIPVVIGIAAKSGYARSKLLMPLVFAAAMGGNLSLIGAAERGPYSVVMVFSLFGGILVPLAVSVVAYREHLTPVQWAAILIMLVAFVFLNIGKKGEKLKDSVKKGFFALCLLQFCANGAYGTLLSVQERLTEGTEKTAKIELFLLCAAQDILEKTKRARGAVFFSATLAPFEAAKRMLGSLEGDACLALPSPFDKHQLDARILPIDLRYAAREANAPRVAEAIRAQLAAHPGNAMVFFPSYAYLSRIDALLAAEGVPGAAILREARGLTEEEKNALLSAFDKRDGRTVLLAVLGGAFAEGVDLAGERLQNVIVVSTGLPQMDARVRAMRRYHDENGADGAFLCMTLPGMVRVIQSAGRLIRTQSDHGALLLIDSRYQRGAERALLSGTLIGDALSG